MLREDDGVPGHPSVPSDRGEGSGPASGWTRVFREDASSLILNRIRETARRRLGWRVFLVPAGMPISRTPRTDRGRSSVNLAMWLWLVIGLPLCVVAGAGDAETARLLLASGADATAKCRASTTPLHWACTGLRRSGEDEPRKAVVLALLEKGADVNAKETDGLTPLHLAAMTQLPDVADLLIARGADVNARDKDGLTPLQSMHEFWRDPYIVDMLSKHGAK